MRYLALFLLIFGSVVTLLVGSSALLASRYSAPRRPATTRSEALSRVSERLVGPGELARMHQGEARSAKRGGNGVSSAAWGWLLLCCVIGQLLAAVLIFLRRAVRIAYGALALAFVGLLVAALTPGGGPLHAGAAAAVAVAALVGWRRFSRRMPASTKLEESADASA